ncbi:hypothetical protein [Actinomycetospora soli]|uniref:hypothetical protein n=1 Tax=Actinomycetospora soli TaxID=2893887 RepID=UPI001E4011A7|nr:hypothetical protein [Actinomycetospora soli]MCD2186582.1 hypothetical protein [Actinomycetospora soli]
MSRGDLLDELVTALRQEGLDAQSAESPDQFLVGTIHRGELAEPARVRIAPTDGWTYLEELKAGWTGDDPDEYAFGMLVMLLVEALSTVHDGENNLVTEVELRRGHEGRLGLHETRLESGAPFLPPGGPYGWTADR